MKINLTLATLALCLALAQADAQSARYLQEVFDAVELTVDVEYGSNTTVQFIQLMPPFRTPLLADVYQPAGDTAAKRPLAILAHAGNFWFKNQTGGGAQGAKDDSCLVYLAHRLARRGYVVAVMNNRTGWNPVSSDSRFTYANALYRGIQDMNTCVRFFKKNATAYQIDPDKIMLWGDGSGGMMALGAALLESIEEWEVAQFNPPGGAMVQESINGDVFATIQGVAPSGYPGIPAGTVLCYPNHVGYDSKVKLAISMGGNLIDTSWIHPGEPALIAFQAQPDLGRPYSNCGPSDHPPFLPIFHIYQSCGSLVTIRDATNKGNNDIFVGGEFSGDFSEIAYSRSGGLEALFPLTSLHNAAQNVPIPFPWRWWGEDWGPGSLPAEVAKPYLDTMLTYVAQRACLALGLDCTVLSSAAEAVLDHGPAALRFLPNPAVGEAEVQLPAHAQEAGLLRLLDLHGRALRQMPTLGPMVRLDLGGLPAGLYLGSWQGERGMALGKVVVR